MNNKVIVTGGAGYIGSHTVVSLLEAGFEPIIIDNYANSSASVVESLREITGKNVPVYELDVTDTMALDTVWKKEQPSYVIHFAAYKAVGESVEKPTEYYRNNLDGLLSVIECMKKYGTKNLVFSSSCTVYGEPDECPVTEASPQKPATSPYGATKQMCERILEDTAIADTDMRIIALRYFNPVGAHPSAKIGELPNGTPNNLVPFLTQAVAGLRGELTVFGNDYDTSDGTCVRDFIHVMDLADAHVASLQYLAKTNKSFSALNIGTGKGNSVMELIEAFQRATGEKVPFKIGPRRAGDVVRVWADASLSTQALSWRPTRTLEDSMRDAWAWQQSLSNK
jgi:UDP-glucose 4-epimerase